MGGGKHRRARFLVAAAVAGWVGATVPAAAQTLRFSTENDLLTEGSARDDLYTFTVALEVQSAGFALSLRENAFTDRHAGLRFDETHLSVGSPLGGRDGWSLAGEMGLVHVGRGLFGERVQNALHRALGGDQVELDYLDSSLHPRLALAAERRVAAGVRFDWGPRLEADLVPGLRSWLLVAVGASWLPGPRFLVEAQVGARFTHASYAPLEPHLASLAPAAKLGIVFDDRFFVSWSYGDYGERREHLTAGYRVPLGAAAPAARN